VAEASRLLRSLTGVKEDLLAWVPHETTRYTALGGVVLSTAAVAALSMFFALREVLGGFSIWMVVPVLGWGLLILNLDRWLVSSTSGTQWAKRLPTLLPRLALAVLFGVVIAEPIVLRVFETAIERHVQDSRTQQLAQLRDQLVRCNPVPGSTESAKGDPAGPLCAGKLLTVPGNPAALSTELTRLTPDADKLQASIKADTDQLDKLNLNARQECAGTGGPGFTGRAGYGPLCQDRQQDAVQFATTHPIQQRQTQLTGMRARISDLQRQLNSSQGMYQGALDAAVDTRVAEERSHQGEIGLLERFEALDRLVGDNAFLNGARWTVRLLFIMIDCLPVLTKLLSGTTDYDHLLERMAAKQRRVFSAAMSATEATETAEWDQRLQSVETQNHKDREHNSLDLIHHRTEMNQKEEAQIALLTKRNLDRLQHRNGHHRQPATKG
jgi:hypothetical protein